MNYRILPSQEWDRLLSLDPSILKPLPEQSICAVAEDDAGEIQGYLFIQLAFHLEPLVIHDKHVSAKRLVETIDEQMNQGPKTEYWAFAPNAKIGRMIELNDMKELPFLRIYKKEVGV